MGFGAILTSDIFGLRSTLDKETLNGVERLRLPRPDPVRCIGTPTTDRVIKSIEFYSLDDGILSARRADTWKRVLEWSDELEALIVADEQAPLSVQDQHRSKELINLIADAIDQCAEFSSVAISALRVRGNRGWNTALLEAVA